MAVALLPEAEQLVSEPERSICLDCGVPVLLALVRGDLVIAQAFEWEPRSRCYVCASIEARANKGAPRCEPCRGSGLVGNSRSGRERSICARCDGRGYKLQRQVERASCSRCGGLGFIGERRPEGAMLAIDVAWSDEGHVRLILPSTSRRRGEALYPLHTCAA